MDIAVLNFFFCNVDSENPIADSSLDVESGCIRQVNCSFDRNITWLVVDVVFCLSSVSSFFVAVIVSFALILFYLAYTV